MPVLLSSSSASSKVFKLNNAELNVIFQVVEGGSVYVLFNADVTVAFIADIRVGVEFLKTTASIDASFFAETKVNVGVGVVMVSLRGSASISASCNKDTSTRALMHFEDEESRALQACDSSIDKVDWALEFSSMWETAEWLKDLGTAIVEGLKEVFKAIEAVWNGIKQFVAQVWEAIKDIAKAIGGAIADVLDEIGKAVDATQDAIGDGLDAVGSFLGDGLGCEICATVNAALRDVVDFTFDRLGDVLDLVSFSCVKCCYSRNVIKLYIQLTTIFEFPSFREQHSSLVTGRVVELPLQTCSASANQLVVTYGKSVSNQVQSMKQSAT